MLFLCVFTCFLAALRSTLGNCWGDSLIYPMLITLFLQIWGNKAWFLSLAKCLDGEPSNSNCNTLTYKAALPKFVILFSLCEKSFASKEKEWRYNFWSIME